MMAGDLNQGKKSKNPIVESFGARNSKQRQHTNKSQSYCNKWQQTSASLSWSETVFGGVKGQPLGKCQHCKSSTPPPSDIHSKWHACEIF